MIPFFNDLEWHTRGIDLPLTRSRLEFPTFNYLHTYIHTFIWQQRMEDIKFGLKYLTGLRWWNLRLLPVIIRCRFLWWLIWSCSPYASRYVGADSFGGAMAVHQFSWNYFTTHSHLKQLRWWRSTRKPGFLLSPPSLCHVLWNLHHSARL